MRILIHGINYRNWFSILCALVTGSSFSHTSIIYQGTRYDTTFKRGYFDQADSLLNQPNRDVTVIEINDIDSLQLYAFINNHEQYRTRYDLKGLLLWPFKRHDPNKYYCFEATLDAIKAAGIELDIKGMPSGGKIFTALLDKGYTATRTKHKYVKVVNNGDQ